jgi:hypothetical protein
MLVLKILQNIFTRNVLQISTGTSNFWLKNLEITVNLKTNHQFLKAVFLIQIRPFFAHY